MNQKQLARLHLMAAKKGYSHDFLHETAERCGVKSLKECS